MKKHDEGYTLLLVIVVILVLSIVSAALVSMSLSNLKYQRASVNRMADKYVAQGEVEKLVAGIETKLKGAEPAEIELAISITETNYPLTAVTTWLSEKNLGDDISCEVTVEEEAFTCRIPLEGTSEGGETTVTCQLLIQGTVVEKEEEPESTENTDPTDATEAPATTRIFTVTLQSITYETYEITTSNEGGGD